MTNQNTDDYLQPITNKLFENLRSLPHVPSVQMQGIKTISFSLSF